MLNGAQNNQEYGQIIAQLQALLKELQKCAPHPDKPDQDGPLFLNSSDYFKIADENDAMLGALLTESFLGGAFSEATGMSSASASAYDATMNAVQTGSDYMSDRHTSNYKLGQRHVIANNFNGHAHKSAQHEIMMNTYLADLPHRLNLETWIASEMRKLYALNKNAPAPSIAA